MMATGGISDSKIENDVDIFGQCDVVDIVSTKPHSFEDQRFDEVIGHIQDIIIDDEFSEIQQTFMERNYQYFEDAEENKFIYTDIHKKYIELIERLINHELVARMPDFDMKQFMASLPDRKDQVPEEILDILTSFTDFLTFKQMILDFKADKEGTGLSLEGLLISSSATSQSNR